ncbi:unnamed protein product [Strongylus vulgaris]|uniref:Uncharacterized protein n=1 Tax=Strongylus vulgaris TaxID=40348 RepID=A0A3P7LSZ9_STRVU|nr:unnamed protein product [Strongylus vulgaris]
MFGMKNGPEHLRMLLLEEKTGKSLINKVPENLYGDGPREAYFPQKLDHFDKSNNITWSQVN